jgi:hypothetical protein
MNTFAAEPMDSSCSSYSSASMLCSLWNRATVTNIQGARGATGAMGPAGTGVITMFNDTYMHKAQLPYQQITKQFPTYPSQHHQTDMSYSTLTLWQ